MNTGHKTAATNEIMQKEHQGTDKKRIESQEMIGNGTETTAPVHHYKIKGIGQCWTAGKKKPHGIEGNIAGRAAENHHSDESQENRHPDLPRRINLEENHDESHKNRIKENNGRSKTGRDILIGKEQQHAAQRKKDTQNTQTEKLRPVDLESFLPQKQPDTENQTRYKITERKHWIYRNTHLQKRFRKKRIETISDTGNDSCSESPYHIAGNL